MHTITIKMKMMMIMMMVKIITTMNMAYMTVHANEHSSHGDNMMFM